MGENRATRWNELAIRLRREVLEIRADGGLSIVRDEGLTQEFSRFDELSQEDSPSAANWYVSRVLNHTKDKYPSAFYWPYRERKRLSDLGSQGVPEEEV